LPGPVNLWVGTGSHAINAPMTLATNTIITVQHSGDVLTLSNDVTANSGVGITKVGDGAVAMKNVRADSLAINAGSVSVIASGTSAATSVVKSLAITAGKMDLQNNKLIVKGSAGGGTATLGAWNGSAYDGITGLIAAGRNGGAWNGNGIVTSQSNAAAPSFLTTLAVASADQIARVGKNFGGQIVRAGDVLVMYTYAGDANLDGKIDADDYFSIDSSYNKSSGLTAYSRGD